MDFYLSNNPHMDTLKVISNNRNAWMDSTPGLGTLEEVEAASHVGYGTVRRIRNGEANPTLAVLDKIAKPFKRETIELQGVE